MAEAMIQKGKYSQTTLSSLPVKVPLGEHSMSDQIQSNGGKVVGFDLPPGKRQKPSAQLTAHSVTFSKSQVPYIVSNYAISSSHSPFTSFYVSH